MTVLLISSAILFIAAIVSVITVHIKTKAAGETLSGGFYLPIILLLLVIGLLGTVSVKLLADNTDYKLQLELGSLVNEQNLIH